MNSGDVFALLPLMISGATVVLVVLGIAAWRHHLMTVGIALGGLVLAIVTATQAFSLAPLRATQLLIVDRYGLTFTIVILVAAAMVVMLSEGYLRRRHDHAEEHYVLVLTAATGAGVLVHSAHFASFFLGLEILSVSLYALIGYQRGEERGIEGALKYLILAALSAALLVFGMGLVYAQTGAMSFADLATAGIGTGAIGILGVGLIVVGLGFKLALVPFHMWTPDVYQGASAPVTAFIAGVSKIAVFALLLRYLGQSMGGPIFAVIAAMAMLSMLVGNLLALKQRNLKRLLAYSSIAHMGYALVALLAAGRQGALSATFYVIAYAFTIIGAFGIIALLSGRGEEVEELEGYRGLAWRSPWLTGALTLMLLSLAGMPVTAGFIGKFLLLTAGVGSQMWGLALVLVVSSTIGIYYYLRVIRTLYERREDEEPAGPPERVPLLGAIAVTGLTLLVVWLGVLPASLLSIIRAPGPIVR